MIFNLSTEHFWRFIGQQERPKYGLLCDLKDFALIELTF